jgi:D-alanyl-D-alanine carboxypeptidase
LAFRRGFGRGLMLRAALLLATLVGAAAPGAGLAQMRSLPRMEAIDAVAMSAMKDFDLAGLSIAVSRGGRLIHATGYGQANIELSAPASPETVYRVGSVTKQFTAVLALRMAEQGRLDLDSPIRRYIPELSNTGDVTVRQLLNHTAGVASFDPGVMPDAFLNRSLPLPQARMIEFIDKAPPDFPAGAKFLYGNSGYLLVGIALERIAGLDYARLVARDLLEPAGLGRTRYDSAAEIFEDRASGYTARAGQFRNAEWNSPTRPFSAGALVSTVLDLVQWNDRLYNGDLLSPGALRIMTTPGALSTGQPIPYGVGIRVTGTGDNLRFAHGGLIVGFSGFLSHYPSDDLDIALLTNTQERGKELVDLESRIAAIFRKSP